MKPAGVIAAAVAAGLRVATAESVTGGATAAALTAVPGASRAFAGGVVAYSPELKRSLLGVSEDALARGIVSEQVAAAMARGALERCGADVAVATTGAAGPEPHDGAAPGTVCIGVATATASASFTLHVTGDRAVVVERAVQAAVDALGEAIGQVSI